MKYAYMNGIILDGTKNMEPVYGKTIIVESGKIKDIVSDFVPSSSYETVDLNGAYILPGLINLHVHLATSGKPPKADSKPIDYKKLYDLVTKKPVKVIVKKLLGNYAKMELFSGCTTIRTVGGILDFDAILRDEIKAGKRVGPRILAGNTGISVPNGHFAGSIATIAASPEEAVEHVHQIAATNPDLIKLMITGGIMDSDKEGEPGVLRMPPEIIKAAADEAHRLGYMVAAHVESPEGVKAALENGVDTIEHGAKLNDETIQLFKERKAAHICTISPAVPYAEFDLSESHALPVAKKNSHIVLEGILECAKTCRENDIPVGFGSDVGCPFITNYNFWRELCYAKKYLGWSEAEILYRATLGNASIVGIDNETGSIEKGKSADMIIVDQNPLEDLSVLRNLSMVVMKGQIYKDLKIKKMKDVDTLLDKYM